MIWLVFATGAALFVALKNVWTRAVVNSLAQRTLVLANFFITGLLALVYLGLDGMPDVSPEFFWSIGTASLIDVLAITMLIRAIFSGDLSDAYPLVALTPVFTIGTSFVVLGESPSLLGIGGVVVIVVGAYLLRIEGSQKSIFTPFKLLFRHAGARYMMLTALMFAMMGPLFKTAMQASSPALALATSQWLSTLWLSIIYLSRGTFRGAVFEIRRNFWVLLGISVTNFFQALGTFLAFQFTFVAYAASVKRLGILFTVLFGWIAFKERGALRGAVAGAVMLVGVVMISLG